MSGFPQGFDPSALGARIADEGPGAVLDQIEELIPEPWREQITAFPLTALALGVGVGVWLGWKKSDDVLEAGMALLSAATAANVSQVMDKVRG
jgi:hypothetical protein